jgi:hypothetical protein
VASLARIALEQPVIAHGTYRIFILWRFRAEACPGCPKKKLVKKGAKGSLSISIQTDQPQAKDLLGLDIQKKRYELGTIEEAIWSAS